MRTFIEFTKKEKKLLIALDAIETVEVCDNLAQVNGEGVDQTYEEIVNLLDEYATISIDRDLTEKD